MIRKAIFTVVVLFGVSIFALQALVARSTTFVLPGINSPSQQTPPETVSSVQVPVTRSTEGLPQPPSNFDGRATWIVSGGDPAEYNSNYDAVLWAKLAHDEAIQQTRIFKYAGFDDATAKQKGIEAAINADPGYAPVFGYTIHNDQDKIYDPLNLYQLTQYSSAPGGDSATKKLIDFKDEFTSIYINDKTSIERSWLKGKSKDQFWREYLAHNGLNEGLTVDEYMARLRANGKISNN